MAQLMGEVRRRRPGDSVDLTIVQAGATKSVLVRLAAWVDSPSNAVAATTYALTTHETSVSRPRSEAIVGNAVARIVWSRTAGSIATTRAANGTRTFVIDSDPST